MGFNYDEELKEAGLLINFGGFLQPYEFEGVVKDIDGYRKSAWIGTSLSTSPIYDVYGPDAVKFLNSVCVNDFTKLGMKGLRHAILCNEKGQILTDGVVIRIGEDRYRTYWLAPVLAYLTENSDMDVSGEDVSGTEYFIQIAGEKSLEILENAFEQDLHDIKFARHRKVFVDGKGVEVIRLGMSGNLAYEIHGPIQEFNEIYDKVWAAGKIFGASRLGLHNYSLFNHTEAGFPNINLHYPLPWFESGKEMADYMREHPQQSYYNLCRELKGSVGDDLQSRFVTPYDTSCEGLIRFDHDFTGKEALQKIAQHPARTAVTLEWNGDDVAKVFATMLKPGEEPCEDISHESEVEFLHNMKNNVFVYRADRVLANGKDIGISSGRIISYHYNSMISLGFIDPAYAKEGTELTLLWGTPGTRQMDIRVKVARYPYNSDFVRNQDKNVEEIPHYTKK